MAINSPSPVSSWVSFYSIMGSAAGALTGLQFIVIALIGQSPIKGTMREIRAFGTPTVVHFCVALLISGVMSAPWYALSNISTCIGICAILGFAYSFQVIWHARKANYKPDAEDWFWYAAVPLAGYVALLTAAILLWWHPTAPLFVIAAATLLFLFAGIHNSWDTVTYLAVNHLQESGEAD